MPVPIPGPKVRSDSQKVKFLMIFGRPKTCIFRRFLVVPAKLIINNVPKGSYAWGFTLAGSRLRRCTGKPELHGSE